MPRVKIDYIVSFSSEDPEHPASNLLQESASGRRWLAPAGSGSASVVLQLSRAVRLSSLSLGAHRAALVEVLVGRSETPEFEVLIPSCVLQTLAEARRGAPTDRVRSFAAEQMADGARDKSWDRVRVVCSQPYDKHCKFGLSFVHMFEPEPAGRPQATLEPRLPPLEPRMPPLEPARRDSEDDDAFRPGALFAAHLQNSQNSLSDPQTSDNQIRQATSRALKNISDSCTKLVKTPLSKDKSRRKDTERDCDRQRESNSSRRERTEHEGKQSSSREITAESRNERHTNFDNSSSIERHKEDESNSSRHRDKSEKGERDYKRTERQSDNRDRDSSRTERHSEKRARDSSRTESHCEKRARDFSRTERQSEKREPDSRRTGRESEKIERDSSKTEKHRKSPNRDQRDTRKRNHQETPRQDEENDTDDEIEKFPQKQKKKESERDKTKTLHTETQSNSDHREEQEAQDNRDIKRENLNGSRAVKSSGGVLPAILDGLTFAVDDGVARAGFDVQLIRRYVAAYGGELVEDSSSANYLLCGARAPPEAGAAPLRADWLWRCHRRGRRARLAPYLLA